MATASKRPRRPAVPAGFESEGETESGEEKEEFLEQTLVEMGAFSKPEVRQREVVNENTSTWSERSVVELPPKLWSTEAAQTISDIHYQLVCMEATLIRLRQTVVDKKQQNHPNNVENLKKLLREVRDTISEVPVVEKRLRAVYDNLQETAGTSVFKSLMEITADLLMAKAKRAKTVILMTTVPIGLYVVFRKLFKG